MAAGAAPVDPANVARRPFVKICGVTDSEGVLAAVAAGADAIGLNLVPGTPRELALDEAGELARLARTATAGDRRPDIVAITADAPPRLLAAIIAAVDPDVVQLAGTDRSLPPVPWDGAPGRCCRYRRPSRRTSPEPQPTSSRAAMPTSPPGSTGSCSMPQAVRIRAAPGRGPRSVWRPRSRASSPSSLPADWPR